MTVLGIVFSIIGRLVARIVTDAVVLVATGATRLVLPSKDERDRDARAARWRDVGGEYARTRGYTFTPKAVIAEIDGIEVQINPWIVGRDRVRVRTRAVSIVRGKGTQAAPIPGTPVMAREELVAIRVPFTIELDAVATAITMTRPTFEDLDHGCAALVALARHRGESAYR